MWIDEAKNPYFTPSSLPSGIVVHSIENPKFFRQMSEDQFTKDFTTSKFEFDFCNRSSVDYCHGLSVELLSALVNTRRRGTERVSLADYCPKEAPRLPDGRLRALHECQYPGDGDSRYQWCTSGIFPYEGKPHLLVRAYHRTPYDDTTDYILRSELLILLRCMLWRGRSKSCLHDAITPILLISVRPKHIRVTECYYDGIEIHLNYGDPIFIEDGKPSPARKQRVESVFRWLASTPQGDTKSSRSIQAA